MGYIWERPRSWAGLGDGTSPAEKAGAPHLALPPVGCVTDLRRLASLSLTVITKRKNVNSAL